MEISLPPSPTMICHYLLSVLALSSSFPSHGSCPHPSPLQQWQQSTRYLPRMGKQAPQPSNKNQRDCSRKIHMAVRLKMRLSFLLKKPAQNLLI